MKKLLVLVVVLIVGGWLGYRYYTAPPEKPQFRCLPVKRGDITIGVTATGRVQPVQVFNVGAQVQGVLKDFGPDENRQGAPIGPNSVVKKDAVLARLDDQQQQIEVDKAIAGLHMAEAELQESNAHVVQSLQNYRRAERLKTTNSTAEYENSVSQYHIAEAELAMSQAKVEQAKIVKKEAETHLEYMTVRAPADGTIIKITANVGQTVSAGQPLFLLEDLRRLQVIAAVNEADISEVHEGQKVTFKLDEYHDETFPGVVRQIRLDASQAASVVSYGVTIDFDNPADAQHPNGKLKPYGTAKVQFEVAHAKDKLLVPDQALRWQPTWQQVTPQARAGMKPPAPRKAKPGEESDPQDAIRSTVELPAPAVWVRADDGLVRPVSVTVGISNGIESELKSGNLKETDEVVISAVRAPALDFVHGFIDKVIKK